MTPGGATRRLLYVSINIGHCKVPALVDTGSELSILDNSLVEKLGLTEKVVTEVGYTVKGAFDQQASEPAGEVDIPFTIGTSRFCHPFTVTQMSNPKIVILGLDFFEKNSYHLSYQNGQACLTINNKKIPVVPRYSVNHSARVEAIHLKPIDPSLPAPPSPDNEARVFRKITILPHATALVKMHLPKSAPDDGSILVEMMNTAPSGTFFPDVKAKVLHGSGHAKHGRSCLESGEGSSSGCIGCADYKFVVIRVRNTSGSAVILPQNCRIATFSSIVTGKQSDVRRSFHLAVKENPQSFKDPKRVTLIMALLGDRCPDRPHLVSFIEDLFAKYPDVVHLKGEKLRVTDVIQHHINYTGKPIWVKQHPIPSVKLQGLLNSIDKLITHASLTGTDSPFNFPAVPVFKKDIDPQTGMQDIRLTVDYSKLNAQCPRDRVNLGTWDEFVTALHGSSIFSKFDLRSSYHQIGLTPESIPKTAFSIHNRRYAYRTVPQGLSNSPSTLARLLNMVFSGMQDSMCIYLDDFLCHSKSVEAHKTLLTEVVSRLSKAKLQVAIEKCCFFTSSASFLGFLVDQNGIHPDPAKTAPLSNKAPPRTVHEVRSTMGMFNVYRRHISNYAGIARPITELTRGIDVKKKNVKISWTPEADAAFRKLKEEVVKNVVLSFPDFTKPFLIFCDASSYGAGGVVSQQVDPEGHPPRPIAFYSRTLKEAEKNYATIDREALSIIHVLNSARSWLLGHRIILRTDHRPLQFIHQNCSRNSRLNRWRALLNEFQPEIQYIKGSDNSIADWLSRYGHSDLPNPSAVSIQDTYVQSNNNSPLPRAVPETFAPEVLDGPIAEMDCNQFKGPIVCLADCMSLKPKGAMAILADMFPHVKDHIAKRVPYDPQNNDVPFCSEQSADHLGTFTQLSGDGPEVILVHHALYEIIGPERKSELQEIRSYASPALAERFRTGNAVERHFYAHCALETLLETWSRKFPEQVYIVLPPKALERNSEQMQELLNQFAFGASQLGAKPILLSSSMFKLPKVKECSVKAVSSDTKPLAASHPWSKDEMVAAQGQDPVILVLKAYISNDKEALQALDINLISKLPVDRFTVIDDMVFHLGEMDRRTALQLFVPPSHREAALKEAHVELAGHGATTKTLYMLRRHFYWPQMYSECIKFVQSCLPCLRTKRGGPDQTFSGKLFTPYSPMDCLAVDILGVGRKTARGHKYVLVAVDAVTRYGWAIPLKTRESREIVDKLHHHIFLTAGAPKYLMHDRGAELTAGQFKDLLQEFQIQQKLTTSYTPTANSACERLNRTILQLLRSLLFEYEDTPSWDTLLATAMSFYNCGYHQTLGNSPFYLFYGRDPNVPYEAILSPVPHHDGTVSDRSKHMAACLKMARESISATQDKNMEKANVKAKNRLDIGDLVFLRERHVARRDHKLLPKFNGPFRIMELLGPTDTPGACVLKSLKSGRTKQVSLRDVKLLPHSCITRTENANAGQVYPIHDDAEVPEHVPHVNIGRHSDVEYDVTSASEPSPAQAVENAEVSASPTPEDTVKSVVPARRPVTVQGTPTGTAKQLPAPLVPRSTRKMMDAGVGKRAPAIQPSESPVASRTRASKVKVAAPKSTAPNVASRTRARLASGK